ncbi:DUF1800 family protein [Mesorhizobium sp. M2D.F.Ca.ET.185.01.1.1]|uniref:DUF1800 domain-containing protein n=3 Tax=Mesorhizobium TaxID=68287 RepID=UPI000FCAE95A|nr:MULTISPECIES: DUF1800 family protein [unclassified Mesorhizobium]TGP78108.1 DUF1800 family protein [bacterium M00.F.Ca.ET.227.01.1.1]TGP88230.1 DUF1800 family protein [bacterium M00.F.Ca.ET.221.01.1.1]TGP93444.1 DUF1800 family protein [bacterium M00.F.Ca.ET.222.01.1.1]TGU12984.1 DUF1800 family protein [bacterium M00.F.Ca.ET.163.01.1.1]TGU31468.1 DUF1800 family protein [bacterium M00.F.Ca.ET.156.01.1.1]TGU45419.1 DUF1800 family protein [bacterium M00.F.Ca.ET.146.01.1.1]TGV69140.1 DUF1800 f
MAAPVSNPVPPDKALVALHRFGLGARPGDELGKIAADPRGYLKAEVKQQDITLIPPDDPRNAGLLDSTAAIQASMAAAMERKAARDEKAAVAMQPADDPAGPAMAKARPAVPRIEADIYRDEAQARFDKALAATPGFVERLVGFWSNHFCVSAAKAPVVRASAGAFEREAIRPFVLGRFADMLLAVEHHPAMLFYLDNQQSIGPDSRAGRRRGRGLNENLAREILELHTLGVGSGYAQADVTSFADMLTGWTMAGREGRLGEPGTFVFNPNAHQPGEAMLLGKTYPGGGMGQAEAALNDIARHPATARHIANKLARHFIADDPPPAAVARLAAVFTKTDGDLRSIALTLIDLPEAWSAPLTKLLTPLDYVVALRRAVGPSTGNEPQRSLRWLRALGQPLWQPPGPNGFSDQTDAWASAEGLKTRLDIAWQAAKQANDIGDPDETLASLIGNSVSAETRQAISRAESKQQSLALLLMAPEFQRR